MACGSVQVEREIWRICVMYTLALLGGRKGLTSKELHGSINRKSKLEQDTSQALITISDSTVTVCGIVSDVYIF